MGWTVDTSYFFWHNYGIDKKFIIPYCGSHLYTLHFNDDWNWLMPVIEKIKDMGYIVSVNSLGSDIAKLAPCGLDPFNTEELHGSYNEGPMINNAFLAVSDFCLTQTKQYGKG